MNGGDASRIWRGGFCPAVGLWACPATSRRPAAVSRMSLMSESPASDVSAALPVGAWNPPDERCTLRSLVPSAGRDWPVEPQTPGRQSQDQRRDSLTTGHGEQDDPGIPLWSMAGKGPQSSRRMPQSPRFPSTLNSYVSECIIRIEARNQPIGVVLHQRYVGRRIDTRGAAGRVSAVNDAPPQMPCYPRVLHVLAFRSFEFGYGRSEARRPPSRADLSPMRSHTSRYSPSMVSSSPGAAPSGSVVSASDAAPACCRA